MKKKELKRMLGIANKMIYHQLQYQNFLIKKNDKLTSINMFLEDKIKGSK